MDKAARIPCLYAVLGELWAPGAFVFGTPPRPTRPVPVLIRSGFRGGNVNEVS